MNISNFIKWLRENANRFFPDRQLYFRTNGDVRFLAFSQKTQIFCSGVLLCVAIWFSVASYNYVYINQIINEKNDEVETVNRNFEELENQYSQLKNDIQKSALALEQRQQYIQQVIDEEEEDVFESNVDEPAPEADVVDDDYDDASDQEARNTIRDERLDGIFVDLKRIEIKQNQTVRNLSEKYNQQLTLLKDLLEDAGIGEEKMLELAGELPSTKAQGGPFIGLGEGINDAPIDSSSFDELYAKRSNLQDLQMAIAYLPIATPPEKHYVSSKFGMRRDPLTRKWATHKGLDMAGWHKTPINAGGSGVVVKAGRNGSFGLFVEIDHGNGFRTKYGHLSKVEVKKGENVTENQLIGLMGSTGRSVGTHLHYEIWFNGKPIDPLKVLKAAKDVQKIKQQKFDS